MSELRIDISSSAPEIESGELHFPSDDNLGTGKYLAFLTAGALKSTKSADLAREIVNRGEFVLSVTLHPDRTISALLGIIEPAIGKTFIIPTYIDDVPPHTIQINFVDWNITSATLDKQRLNVTLTNPSASQDPDSDSDVHGPFG